MYAYRQEPGWTFVSFDSAAIASEAEVGLPSNQRAQDNDHARKRLVFLACRLYGSLPPSLPLPLSTTYASSRKGPDRL